MLTLSSVVAHVAFDDSAIYWAVKGAVEVLTLSLEELPRGIRVDADDIADAVPFLASDRSRRVDGRSLEVSGGANLRLGFAGAAYRARNAVRSLR